MASDGRARRRAGSLVWQFAVLALLGCASSPSATVTGFYKDLEAGRVESAMGRLSTHLKSQLGADKLKAALEEASLETKKKGGVADFRVTSEVVTGEVAEVEVSMKYGNGSTDTDKVKLVKEEGDWKIDLSK
jgi:hypothetical protein